MNFSAFPLEIATIVKISKYNIITMSKIQPMIGTIKHKSQTYGVAYKSSPGSSSFFAQLMSILIRGNEKNKNEIIYNKAIINIGSIQIPPK